MSGSSKEHIAIKRIYDAVEESDGYRVLVDRIWPRGVSKDAAALDAWNKDVAPSTELRKWFDHKAEKFDEFAQRYDAELTGNPATEMLLQAAGKKKITLLYSAHDTEFNQAVVLARFLRSALRK